MNSFPELRGDTTSEQDMEEKRHGRDSAGGGRGWEEIVDRALPQRAGSLSSPGPLCQTEQKLRHGKSGGSYVPMSDCISSLGPS